MVVDYQRAFETVAAQVSKEYEYALQDYKRDADELAKLVRLEGPRAVVVARTEVHVAKSRHVAERLASLLSTVEIMSDGTAGVPYDTSAAELRAVQQGDDQ